MKKKTAVKKINTPANVEKLAKEFSSILRTFLNKEEMDQIVATNKEPGNEEFCATHTYCDPNEIMAEAFENVIGREYSYEKDEDVDLWNAAWSMAKKNEFYPNEKSGKKFNNGGMTGKNIKFQDHGKVIKELETEVIAKDSSGANNTVPKSRILEEYSKGGDIEEEENNEVQEMADKMNVPEDVIQEWVDDGHDVDSAEDAYQGSYKDEEDYAYEMVEQGVITDLTSYLDMTDTDRRIVAGEEADNIVDNMDEDELIEQADMEEELKELEAKRDRKDELESEIANKTDEIDDLESEDEPDEEKISAAKANLEEAEAEFAEIDGFDFDDKKTDLANEAKEKVRENNYDEIYEKLSDPLDYFVNEQGIYSKEDLAKANFIRIDYKYLAKELGYDVTYIDGSDGQTYVFSNNYAKGGKIKNSSIGIGDTVTIKAEKIAEQRSKQNPSKGTAIDKQLKLYESLSNETGTVYNVGSQVVGVKFSNGKKASLHKDWLAKLPSANEVYKGFELRVKEATDNPNGRKSQTVLIYKDGKPVGGAFADVKLEDAIEKAKAKIDKGNFAWGGQPVSSGDVTQPVYADGGKIENQYEGKTPAEVWNTWTVEQRLHFLNDHNKQLEKKYRYKGLEKVAEFSYDRVGVGLTGWVEDHIKAGQYAKGGSTDSWTSTPIKHKYFENKSAFSYFKNGEFVAFVYNIEADRKGGQWQVWIVDADKKNINKFLNECAKGQHDDEGVSISGFDNKKEAVHELTGK